MAIVTQAAFSTGEKHHPPPAHRHTAGGQEGQALVYVAGAVPHGSGTQHPGRQGPDKPVRNAAVPVTGPGEVSIAVRAVQGLDMIQLQGSGLAPDTTYTVSARHDHDRLPLLSFTTDAKGWLAQALAFTKFLDVYTQPASRPAPAAQCTNGLGPEAAGGPRHGHDVLDLLPNRLPTQARPQVAGTGRRYG